MKDKKLIIAALLLILAGGYWLFTSSANTEKKHSHEHNEAEEEHASGSEGRTKISAEAAKASEIETDIAGAATIREIISLTGRITLNPNTTANVKARFPGVIRAVKKQLGDAVKIGDTLATVESNDSLQIYPVKSPISGIVLSRNANAGEVAGDSPLFTIADLSNVWAEFHVFQRDFDKVKIGQQVNIRGIEGNMKTTGKINSLLPVTEASSQTVIARVTLDNANGNWRSGMTVHGDVVINERKAPMAVKTSALQRFRDNDVVFAQVGDVYEVRIVELGANDGEWAEVLSGLKHGTKYVTENSFLIKADIEKSGAGHDH